MLRPRQAAWGADTVRVRSEEKFPTSNYQTRRSVMFFGLYKATYNLLVRNEHCEITSDLWGCLLKQFTLIYRQRRCHLQAHLWITCEYISITMMPPSGSSLNPICQSKFSNWVVLHPHETERRETFYLFTSLHDGFVRPNSSGSPDIKSWSETDLWRANWYFQSDPLMISKVSFNYGMA